MKVSFTSLEASINDFITDNGLTHEEVDEPQLIKWGNDCVRWLNTDEQYVHRIALCPVINYRAELPKDFKILQQAASNPDYGVNPCLQCDPENAMAKPYQRTRREQITQWIQNTYDQGCELEINLKCPTCSKTECTCDTPIIEVDVDRMWEMSHPEIFYKNYEKIGRFGYGDGYSNKYIPDFKLMGYATSDFFNIEHILTDCPNIRCTTCVHKFKIELPYIKVDYQKGEVLLAYLGKVMDENGDLRVPDHPDAHEAVYSHLTHKYYFMKFIQTGERRYDMIQRQARATREEAIAMARSALQLPDFKSFKEWVNDIWMRRIPKDADSLAHKTTTDSYIKYKHYLDGRIVK